MTDWASETKKIYDHIRSETTPYDIEVDGHTLTVLPNVFSPKYFTDSEYFAREIANISAGKSMLEIGTGTGIVAVFAAMSRATVVATDINSSAIENARLNAERLDVEVDVREGNLFDPIAGDEKFDLIFWNHPFNKSEEEVDDILLRAGFDHEYHGVKQYLREGHKYLSPGGKLLLGTGGFADREEINSFARECEYSIREVCRQEFPIEHGADLMLSYIIYEYTKD